MSAGQPDPRRDAGEMDPRMIAELGSEYRAYVERARQYHALHGVWPPDPLLDEVDEMRRRIMAEHGQDWRKVLQWHLERDERYAQQNEVAPKPECQDPSAAVTGR